MKKLWLCLCAIALLPACAGPLRSVQESGASAQPSVPRETRAPDTANPWRELGPGIERRALAADAISVFRIDLRRLKLTLFNSSAADGRQEAMEKLARREGLLAAIPASMYKTDFLTSVSYMRNYGHRNNPRHSQGYHGVLLFNPKSSGQPPVRIMDNRRPDFARVEAGYHSAVGLIRMVGGGRPVRWTRAHVNAVTLGTDKEGRLLIFHSRHYLRMERLIELVLESDLGVGEMVYVEGGSKGGIFLEADGRSYSSGYLGPLPNVLGISLRQ
jgi:hypothetical protein